MVAAGQNDVRTERDQLCRLFTSTIGIAGAPTPVDPHIAALGPAQLLQAPHERPQTSLPGRTSGHAHEHTDAPHPLRLLRARRERPRGCRAAEQRDELAPHHSITSSARASMIGGISRPIALAVLTLITSVNLVGRSIGKSAALAPLRMRSNVYRCTLVHVGQTGAVS